MIRLIVIGAMSLLCASCFSMESRSMADGMNLSPPFKLCLTNHGVDPDQFISCVRTTDSRSELDSCIPKEKHHEVMECMDAQAAKQPPG
jgi:hypothetical protein